MPEWFYIAFVSPVLWAMVNHFDKYATVRFKGSIGIGGIMVVTSLISVILLPVSLIFNSNVLDVPLSYKLILIGNGLMNSLAGLVYMYAIQDDEASLVAPLFQLVPVIGYFLGYILLGETLSGRQIIGSLIIILGSAFLLIDLSGTDKQRFKWKIGLLMFLSSFLYASFQVLFKVVAIRSSFWASVFWEYTGIFISGIFFIVFIKSYRQNFFNVFRERNFKFIKLMGLLEAINILGNLATAYASLLAPIALIMIVNSYQPFFVFSFGVIITLYFPFIGKELINGKQLLQKIFCIITMIAGSYILYR